MDKAITWQGNPLHYRVEGPASVSPPGVGSPVPASSGAPLVLLHGFAEDNLVWEKQLPLAKDHPLIIPDLPGSGQSSPLAGGASMEALADTVTAILDAEGISQCILVGHSMGGYVTLAVAEKYPQRLKAIGLFHSTAYGDSEEKKANRRKGIEFIRKNGAAPFIRQSVPNLFTEANRKINPGIISTLIDRYSHFDPNSLVDYYEAMIQRPDRTSVLRSFPRPVLFIIGEQDTAVPLEHALQQCHLPGLSYIHILPESAHMGMWENTDHSNSILQSFINFTLDI